MSITKKVFVGALVAAFVVTFASANAAYVHTTTLKMGVHSSQVTALQQTLNMTSCKVSTVGAGSPGMETSTFAAKTKAAVMCFQASHGLTADGVVGPMTGAALAAVTGSTGGTTPAPCPAGYVCTPNGGTTGGSVGLSGSAGTIDSVAQLSQYSNEKVGESESDIKVLGFELGASNDGDIALKSIKLTFNDYAGSGSTRIADYVDSVSVWQGDTKVGSADAADFNKDSSGVYSKTITLNNPVVKADQKSKFYITVDAASNFDSTDIASTPFDWHLDVDSIRYVDGSGVVTTEDATGDLPIQNVGINFVSFSSAADTELKISTDSNTPKAAVVIVDDQDTTSDVSLLKGKMKLDGTSDVTINELPITLTATSSTANGVDDIAGSVTLKLDGEEFSKTVNITSALTGTIVFDDLNFDVSAGDTVSFEVLADVNDLDGTVFAQGDTLKASLTSTNRDYMDVENEEGDQLSDSTEKSGTTTGNAQEFRTSGVSVTYMNSTAVPTAGNSANDDLGTFTLKFKVGAVGDTIYVSSLADAKLTGVTTGKISVNPDRAGTATIGGSSVTLAVSDGSIVVPTLNAAGLYEIPDGEYLVFEVTTTLQLPAAGSAGQYRVALGGVSWTTDSTDSDPNNAYTSNLTNFKTSYLGLN